jgi:hypothetical protein
MSGTTLAHGLQKSLSKPASYGFDLIYPAAWEVSDLNGISKLAIYLAEIADNNSQVWQAVQATLRAWRAKVQS